MVPNAIENDVIPFAAFSEIRQFVVNHVIRADGADHFHISGAAYSGHLRAERLGDLHRERTHASRRTVDQNLLPRLNLSLVAQALQGGQSGERRGSGLREGDVLGFKAKVASGAHTYSAKDPWP